MKIYSVLTYQDGEGWFPEATFKTKELAKQYILQEAVERGLDNVDIEIEETIIEENVKVVSERELIAIAQDCGYKVDKEKCKKCKNRLKQITGNCNPNDCPKEFVERTKEWVGKL